MKRKWLFGVLILFLSVYPAVFSVNAETDAERRQRLEKELQNVEKQILVQQVLLDDKQVERQSLERDLDIIDTQINKAQLGIKARNVAIAQLTDQIGEKAEVIEILNERMIKQRRSIGELIRKTNEVDGFSLVELLLSNQNFSEFFADFESYRSINDSLKNSLRALEIIEQDTHMQVESLSEKQEREADMRRLQELEKAEIEKREDEKEQILKITKGEEEAYQELLETKKKTAAQLRAELFDLLGGGGSIPLTDAINLAKTAGGAVGVDPALILAILQQESSFGQNIGSCTMGDTSDGKDIMHPDRDKPVFLAISETLGFNSQTQVVSCPLRRADGTRIGWGGAMGASQFIPSTWAIYGGYVNYGGGWTYDKNSDAIKTLLGKSMPSSPFNNQDAFTATALLLRDNGANGSYASDRLAALRYYAGWGGASNPANFFYGDQVMQRKAQLEQDIQVLDGN